MLPFILVIALNCIVVVDFHLLIGGAYFIVAALTVVVIGTVHRVKYCTDILARISENKN